MKKKKPDPEAQAELDFTAARAARDEGIQRAVDHANDVEPRWADKAFSFLDRFIVERGAKPFTSEDVREASQGHVNAPPNLRAWGGVLQRASRAGLIVRHGYDTARDPKVHCNVVTLWRARHHQETP